MNQSKKISKLPSSQILLYTSSDGEAKIEVKLENETVWLTQDQMSQLFKTDRTSITKHIQNIFETGELDQNITCAKFAQHLPDGRAYQVSHYNLDVIISVGYRISSFQGTQFRIWATKQLKEYLVKGFVLNDQRLSEGQTVNKINYFDELLDRVRAIRASEKNLYQKVKDIFATSIDYSSQTDEAKDFYSTVQNKFHFAVTGETAAELIVHRIGSEKPNLGMTNWKSEQLKSEDAKIAKNYMLKEELEVLYLLVEQFLSFAELQIKLQRPMYMKDWRSYLDDFLKLNRLEILKGRGSVSHEQMEKVVSKQLSQYLKLLKD